MIMQDEDVEIVEQSTEEQVIENDPVQDPQTGMMIEVPPTVIRAHDIKVSRTVDKGKVRIENVPPEEFLISKRARTISDSDFVAHRKMTTRSDLIAMGYDED